MEQNELQEYNYPDYIIASLHQLMESSMSADKGRLRDDASVVSLLYNTFNDYPITPQVYSLLWSWLLRKVRAGHDNWVKHYWSQANQYYTFKLEHARNTEFVVVQKEAFKEFHLMVGVMLLHYEKHDVLKYIFSFSNTLPPKYPLILGTFQEIFHTYVKLSKLNERMYLLKYSVSEVFCGAGEEKKIESYLANYIALLFIRLVDVQDYNITYSNPLELPSIPTDANVDNLSDITERIRFLSSRIQSTPIDLIKNCGISKEGVHTALQLMHDYEEVCTSEIVTVSQRIRISEDKRKIIRQSLIESSHRFSPYLPKFNGGNLPVAETYNAQQILKLDDRLILDKYGYISSNTGEALINALNVMAQHQYCMQFLYNSAVYSVGVPYPDLSKALEMLSLTPDYAILAMGMSYFMFKEIKGFNIKGNDIDYKGCKVYDIPSNREQSFIIMRASDVPTISIAKVPTQLDNDEGEIDTDSHLYSNIDILTEQNLELKVKMAFEFHCPDFLRYVRIRVAPQLESDPKILQNIKSVNEYL